MILNKIFSLKKNNSRIFTTQWSLKLEQRCQSRSELGRTTDTESGMENAEVKTFPCLHDSRVGDSGCVPVLFQN